MEILYKNFLVYGTGLSGTSAVSFLLKKGAKKVYIFDDNNVALIKNAHILKNFKDIKNLDIECVILSPGVNVLDNPNIEFLKDNNINYISEFCLGFLYSFGTKICITGTNGKTTTVNLLYQIIKKQYDNVFLCGNTDCPITQIALDTNYKSILICEVSSFALESITKDFKPDISAILNITVDHLSRHKTFENYQNAKLNITNFQTSNNFFVCNKDFYCNTQAQRLTYTLNQKDKGVYLNDKKIYYKNKKIIKINKIKLLGEKNIENILCAITIAKILKIKNKYITKTIKNFEPLKHRMQKVFSYNDIDVIDDSKATNPDSTICALLSIKKPIILLLGGSDKGYEYDSIFKYCTFVKHIVTFGQMNKKIKTCAQNNNFFNVTNFDTLKYAVLFAKQIAQKGDVILLSPACASFDEFKSYSHRGEMFLEYIKGDEKV